MSGPIMETFAYPLTLFWSFLEASNSHIVKKEKRRCLYRNAMFPLFSLNLRRHALFKWTLGMLCRPQMLGAAELEPPSIIVGAPPNAFQDVSTISRGSQLPSSENIKLLLLIGNLMQDTIHQPPTHMSGLYTQKYICSRVHNADCG